MTDARLQIHMCEKCRHRCEECIYVDYVDEYWCPNCVDNAAEAAWERQQAADMECPPKTLLEQQIEARKLK